MADRQRLSDEEVAALRDLAGRASELMEMADDRKANKKLWGIAQKFIASLSGIALLWVTLGDIIRTAIFGPTK